MIRLLNAYFPLRTVALGISEVSLVTLAFVGAAAARLGASDAAVMLRYEQGFLRIVVIAAVFSTCMYYFDLYDPYVLRNRREIATRLVQVAGTLCVLLAILYYAYPPLELGRGIFDIGLSVGAITLFFWRRLFLMLNALPQFVERTVILGGGSIADSLTSELRTRSEFGIGVVAQLRNLETSGERHAAVSNEEAVEAFLSSVRHYRPDRVILALSERRGTLPAEALLQLKGNGVRIQDGAQLYEAITGKVHIESLRASSFLLWPAFTVSHVLLLYKRAASLVLATIGLIFTFPLMVMVAIAIRLDSGGPVFFQQKRVGYRGEIFTLYKFRTMVNCNEGDNQRPTEISDARFTRIGRWLRRTRIDELPQLANIVRGDMHFIGPRPFVINQEQECVENIPFYRQRWAVRPGATGWAQVNRGYNVTIDDNREKFAYDLFYIKNVSVGLDILILFKTIKIMLLGRGSR